MNNVNMLYKDPKILEAFYWKEGLSLTQIAENLDTNDSVIRYWMIKNNLRRRKPKRNVPEKYSIPKQLLEELYLKKDLSIKQIAKKLRVNYEIIRLRLIKYSIPIRPRHPKEKYKITKNQLENFYLKQKLSTRQIARRLGIKDNKIIQSRLIKYNIPRRTIPEATTRYPKKSFSGNLKEKAYMIGLRTGDFSASKNYKLIRIMGSTTKLNQIKMFKEVFKKYGHVNYFKTKKHDGKDWSLYCYLNESFNFLLKKLDKIPKWIFLDDDVFYSFLAGYSDAEGCWVMIKDGVDAIRFGFCLASCDKIILQQIKNKLEKVGFKVCFRLRKKVGEKTNYGIHNKDYFALVINRKHDVIFLAKILSKLSNHLDKINKMKIILKNQNKKWSEFKNNLSKTL